MTDDEFVNFCRLCHVDPVEILDLVFEMRDGKRPRSDSEGAS